jgi:hypothetical protein
MIHRQIMKPLDESGCRPRHFNLHDARGLSDTNMLTKRIASETRAVTHGPTDVPHTMGSIYGHVHANPESRPVGRYPFQFERHPMISVAGIS